MVKVFKEGVILNKTNLGFENEGVLNPAAIYFNGKIHIFYRAVSKGNYSSIGYCRLTSPMQVEERHDVPIIFPQGELEVHGIEDPRIVRIEDIFYLTYTAYDGINALGCLAYSKDLLTFEKVGIIVPKFSFKEFRRLAESRGVLNEKYFRYNDHGAAIAKLGKNQFVWDKNVMFFPRRINGKLYFLHRVKPDIQLVSVNDLSELTDEFWQNYFMHIHDNILLTPKFEHEISYIGGGCPPIETKEGWLLIYHSVHDTVRGYVYSACAALLDLENPLKEISRLPYVLFKPDYNWETEGYVNNVCFPSGAIVENETLYIYYGAADEQIACASIVGSPFLVQFKSRHSFII